MRHLGGGELILGCKNGKGTSHPMNADYFSVIGPLLERQPYVSAVTHRDDPTNIDFDLFHFRETYPRHPPAHNLIVWQQDHLKIKEEIDISPWLTNIEPSDESRGRAVFARSLRYHNPNFRWPDIGVQYPDALFVGFEDEHREFCKAIGRDVPWRKTGNLLEVAQLIRGSTIFASNQSVGTWIAIGMGHPFIQEVSNWNADSIIPRENGDYRRCL